ncbi:DUF1902 domain-containing protein [Bosea sp. LjRoot90]|uniref:DUF1902 domain-containing protein n=1 Tax=Bosea sp. LjRoot90 TaxID=3342342 RepID=UPI003ECE22D7
MRIVTFDVRRDDEAGVWYASSTSDAGIVTEAETIEALRERLTRLLPECFGIEGCRVELTLCCAEADLAQPSDVAISALSRT